MWMSDSAVKSFIDLHEYDIRKSHNARWIDQKCTPDVLTIICDCIFNYLTEKGDDCSFTSMDIWHCDYAETNVLAIFKKPNPNADVARNEYDKFFQQPIKLLSYAGVLKETKVNGRNFYSLVNKEVLEYIALREKNSLWFLKCYITKVLADSKILFLFEDFFQDPNKDSYRSMKEGFTSFTIRNTPINKKTECWRIFIKVLNPLSYFMNCNGTERGNMSKNIITYDMLMYNRDNFRDLYSEKPKGMTRKEFDSLHPNRSKENPAYFTYLSAKAKKAVREYNNNSNNGLSEIYDPQNREFASHVHHIFPESDYPTISYFYENLIALDPSQHLNHAHPNGNTSMIDKGFQLLCLMAKNATIKKDYDNKYGFYDFKKFMIVLCTGLNNEVFSEIGFLDFLAVTKEINQIYQGI